MDTCTYVCVSAISPISITISIICYLLLLCIVICLSVLLVIVVVAVASSCLVVVVVVASSRVLHLVADNLRMLLIGNCQMHEILYLPRSLLRPRIFSFIFLDLVKMTPHVVGSLSVSPTDFFLRYG